MKENHGEVREALLEGIIAEKGASPPDIKEWNRRHGRIEVREYWWVEADEEMKRYLEQEFGWPEVRWYGRVRRRRALLHSHERSDCHLWGKRRAEPDSSAAQPVGARSLGN